MNRNGVLFYQVKATTQILSWTNSNYKKNLINVLSD